MTEKRKGVHSLGFFHHPSLFSLPYLLSPIRLYETAEDWVREDGERTNQLISPFSPSSVRVLRSNRQRGEGTGKRDGTGKGISLFIPSSFPFHWWLLSPLTLTNWPPMKGKGSYYPEMLFSSRSHISPFHVMSLTNSLASTTERTGT